MRLAHFILAHKNPHQLERLVKRLVHPDADIYIHLDGKTDIEPFRYIADLPNVTFTEPRKPVGWADFTCIPVCLDAFDDIIKTGKPYSHINLLSGQDYPLKSAAEIQEFLFQHPDKTFMRYRDIYKNWPATISRLEKYHFGVYDFPLKWKLQWVVTKLPWLFPKKKLPNNLTAYGRSQWFTMNIEGARYAIDYMRNNPNVFRFFKQTWGCDEIVFQTILINSHLKDTVIDDHLRYIRFKRGNANPDILTMDDVKILVGSGKFYARKFDTNVDEKIMDYFDQLADKKQVEQ
ncbi:beta-1,6-N-acetylglucosaminyltransferase [Mucilaginibacter myungsuensis]|uniref:Peptide O-xylosyltransferase n=1 Tax=Mucilaginibacter myungsuensis TaxID=649104 RepID=A0A929PWS0_9SPHI|nr:beta-1,6-N-acetylglucosaminyltransferase [Mucilaginibacter myungsuensis]MBE9661640.1 glycosyl transferase [Mucilaginibacter myungsuensis]MDN3597784.1 beta-1,6-N-acetylglucosaminyltransferase [Mucilaginibacter myungsuensis]